MSAPTVDAVLEGFYSLKSRSTTRAAAYADLRQRSEALSTRPGLLADVRYGPTPRERMDVFTQQGGAPVFVFIHGGFWRALEKEIFLSMCAPFADRGFVAVNMDYGLRPDFTLPEIVEQVLQAIAYIADNAADYGGRADRIVLCGHSAGGHMVAWAAAADWPSLAVKDIDIKAVIPVSGIFDLEPLRQTSINNDLALDADTARRMSPIRYLDRALPPMLGVVGGDETQGFIGQTQDFDADLQAAGHISKVLIAEGHDHFSICQALADPDSAEVACMTDFIEAHI